MFDPPHLIKNIRNNFKKSGFTLNSESIKWEYVEQFFKMDSRLPIHMAPKLTTKHLDLPPFTAMRVRLATQLLSHSVAVGISVMCSMKHIDEDAMATASFIEKMDSLFDAFNSSSLSNSKKMRTAIRSGSPHISFIKECMQMMSHLKQAGTVTTLPCIEGWQLSMASLISLWHTLHNDHNIQFLLTNRLNQDCLENFFSVIRGKGGPRDNPNAVQFRAAYRTASVDSLFVLSKVANCCEDSDSFLLQCENIDSQKVCKSNSANGVQDSLALTPFSTDVSNLSLSEKNIIVYLAGYLVIKAKQHFSCGMCASIWNSNETDGEEFIFLQAKQHKHQSDAGLVVPSHKIKIFVSEMESLFRQTFPFIMHTEKLCSRILNKILAKTDMPKVICGEGCNQSRLYLMKLFITLCIHHVVRKQNRLFKIIGQKRNRKVLKLLHV